MRLIYQDNRFVCVCTYMEREIPKGAGFRWDAVAKKWWTADQKVALRLQSYADNGSTQAIKERTVEGCKVGDMTDYVSKLLSNDDTSCLTCPDFHTGGPYRLRPYQQEAVDKGVRFLNGSTKGNGIIIAPTGSGKSLIISGIVKALGVPTLVLQPSKEILEQNISKLNAYGIEASVYSASMGCKKVSDITFATIGSVIGGHCGRHFPDECGYDVTKPVELWQPNHDYSIGDRVKKSERSQLPFRCYVAGKSGERVPDLERGVTIGDRDAYWICDEDCDHSAYLCTKLGLRDKFTNILDSFRCILIDECHLVSARDTESMYNSFIKKSAGSKVLGLTATPYRLATNSWGTELRFLTRTRPRIFNEVVYFIQNKQLFDEGYLCKLAYCPVKGFDRNRLQLNSTGADFDDKSVRAYYGESGFQDNVCDVILQLQKIRKNILVFTRFIEESEFICRNVRGARLVTGSTPMAERLQLVNDFKNGNIRVVVNVNVLGIGFDFPQLETIVLANPTMSLARYYQQCGRGLRPHPDKKSCLIVDMTDNLDTFGKIETLEIVDTGNGKFIVSNMGKQLTNTILSGERK